MRAAPAIGQRGAVADGSKKDCSSCREPAGPRQRTGCHLEQSVVYTSPNKAQQHRASWAQARAPGRGLGARRLSVGQHHGVCGAMRGPCAAEPSEPDGSTAESEPSRRRLIGCPASCQASTKSAQHWANTAVQEHRQPGGLQPCGTTPVDLARVWRMESGRASLEGLWDKRRHRSNSSRQRSSRRHGRGGRRFFFVTCALVGIICRRSRRSRC